MSYRKSGWQVLLTSLPIILSTILFGSSPSQAQTFHNIPIEEIVEMKFPVNVVRQITRTGLQYMDDYQDLGIQTKGLPAPGMTTQRTTCYPDNNGNFHENDFCFANNIDQTLYHDATDNRYNQHRSRGAIDIPVTNENVYAGVVGTVVIMPNCTGNDGLLSIELEDGRFINFLHLASAADGIDIGTEVTPDTHIAVSGNCGDVPPHLHLYAESADRQRELEIRFTDRYVQFTSGGIPIPRWYSTTGRSDDGHDRSPYIYPDSETLPGIWPPLEIDSGKRPLSPVLDPADLRLGMRVRIVTGANMYRHLEYEADNRVRPTVNSIDRGQTPLISTGRVGYIRNAPRNWDFSTNYPPYVDNVHWWLVNIGSRNDQFAHAYWVSESDLTTCLSEEWCDIEITESLYPFAREAKFRSDPNNLEQKIGAFSGCYTHGSYSWLCADANLERDQAAKIVWEIALGRTTLPACTEKPFPDVEVSSSFCPYIKGLVEKGIIQGKSNGYFDPSAQVTKGEMASMVAKALDETRFNCSDANGNLFRTEITDVPTDNPHYSSILCLWNALRDRQGELHAKFGTSVILGNQGVFSPDDPITRIQSTKLLAASMVILRNVESEPEESQGNGNRGSGICFRFWGLSIGGCNGVAIFAASSNVVTTQLVTPWGDEDWMTLQIEESAADFTLFSREVGLNAWIEATLFDSDGNIVASEVSGERSPQFSLKADLEEGVYYIRLRNVLPYARWGTDYKLNLVVRPGELLNIAPGKTVTASAGPSTAALITDGDPLSAWQASAFGPQWIKIDFGQDIGMEKLRLLVDQTPSGETIHDLYIFRDEQCSTPLFLHRFEGYTQNNDWLEYNSPTTPILTRCVQIQTVQSPSWVAWYEAEVYERQEQSPIPEPEPEPEPPTVEPNSYAEIFEATTIENIRVDYNVNNGVSASFRVYNRSGRGLQLPVLNGVCQVGFWRTSLRGTTIGWLAHDSDQWDGPTCYWPNGEYVEYYASQLISLAPGEYNFDVAIYYLNFPSEKSEKIATLPFLISPAFPSSPSFSTNLMLPILSNGKSSP